MLNTGMNPTFQMYAQQVTQPQQQQQNPFLQMPMVTHAHQQPMMYDMNQCHPQQQQQQQQLAFMPASTQQHEYQQRQIQMQQMNAMNLVSGSQMGDCDSGESEGDSQVLCKQPRKLYHVDLGGFLQEESVDVIYVRKEIGDNNPDQVRSFFEEFLKNTRTVDHTNIDLRTVNEYYNISFKALPSDDEMSAEFSRMVSKYTSSSQKGQKKNWNDNETKILCWIVIKACALQNLDCRTIEDKIWDDITKMMIGRTSESCKFKWLSLSKLNLQQIPWSAEEDQLLIQTIIEYNASNKGNKWSEISKELNSKSKKNVFRQGKQCRERWNNHLDPAINRDPWQDKEDLHLLQLIIEKGKKWSDVSKELRSNRTENNVKNRFNSIIKKEKQSLEEMQKSKIATEIPANSSEQEIITFLIRKYTSRISNGFPLHCKEEDFAHSSNTNQNGSNLFPFNSSLPNNTNNSLQIQSQHSSKSNEASANKSDQPVTKIEKQKNKLKDLIQSELKTKGSSSSQAKQLPQQQQQQQQQSYQSMNLEEVSPASSSSNMISQPNIENRQTTSLPQEQQNHFGYQNYFHPHQFMATAAVAADSFSPAGFKSAPYIHHQQMSQNSMSPNTSHQGTPVDSQNKQHLASLGIPHSQFHPQPSSATSSSSTHQLIQLFAANQPHLGQQQQTFVPSASNSTLMSGQTQKDQTGTYKVRNATDLQNASPEFIQQLSLAFFNPQNQELVEIDHQLLEEYTSQQVRMQLHQYSQNLKTPQQTPKQAPQNSFQMMFNSISNQIAQQQGSNSPQYTNLYTKVSSPNILSHYSGMQTNNGQAGANGFNSQPFLGIMGTPISPQTNLFGMLPSLSPQGVASGFNTPNDMNLTGNSLQHSENIRSINQMEQYANFYRMNQPQPSDPNVHQNQQQQHANSAQQQYMHQNAQQQNYTMFATANNPLAQDVSSPQTQTNAYYLPGNS